MSNFNEMFRKDVTWDNIKNSQKTRAFYRRCIYGKTTEGIKLTLVKFLRVNPDTSKQALEIAFSHKKCNYSWNYIFYNLPVVKENIQKHLSLFLNIKLNFLAHINEKIKEVNKVISVIKKLNQPLPYSSLMTRYKSFVRPHLDYGDSFFFSIRIFFHRHWRLTGQQGKGGDHLLFHSTTSTRSRTFRYLFATLHVRWLSQYL